MWQMGRGKFAIWRVPHKFWPQTWFTPTRHTPVHCARQMAIFGNIFSSACLLCASAWKTPQALEKRFLGQDLSNAPTPTSIRCLNPEISIFNVWVSLASPRTKREASFKYLLLWLRIVQFLEVVDELFQMECNNFCLENFSKIQSKLGTWNAPWNAPLKSSEK